MVTLTFGNTGTRPYGVLTVTETATSVANNTSTLSIVLTLKRPYAISSTASKTATCTINGETYTWNGFIGGSGDLVLISKTQTVPHNSDGTKTISISASIQLDITWSDEWVGTIRSNGTMRLTSLPVNPPTIGAVTYQDANASVVAITGNNQLIVQNLSLVKFNVTGLAATNATIASVTATVNGTVYYLTVSGSTATNAGININSASDLDVVITVTDSRGLKTSKTITIQMVAWSIPTAVITATRQNNYYTATSLTVNAGYTDVGSNTVSITYACTEDSGTLANVTGTLQDGVTSVIQLNNNYSWTVWVHLTDSFGGKSSYKAYVSRGMPIIYFDTIKSSIGVNCFPKGTKTLEVNGVDVLSQKTSILTINKTGTTDSYGNLNLGMDATKFVVYGVKANITNNTSTNLICVPFISNYNGYWHSRIMTVSNGTNWVVSKNITFTVWYSVI